MALPAADRSRSGVGLLRGAGSSLVDGTMLARMAEEEAVERSAAVEVLRGRSSLGSPRGSPRADRTTPRRAPRPPRDGPPITIGSRPQRRGSARSAEVTYRGRRHSHHLLGRASAAGSGGDNAAAGEGGLQQRLAQLQTLRERKRGHEDT